MDFIDPSDIPEGFGGGAAFGLRDLAVTATCVTYLAMHAHLDPSAPPEIKSELSRLAGDWGQIVQGPLRELIGDDSIPEEVRHEMAECLGRTGNDFTAMAYDIKANTGVDLRTEAKPKSGAIKRMTEKLHRSDKGRGQTHDLVREIADQIEGIDAR